MVNNELELTYDQLAAMPLFEQWVTIACVSNEVGGNLVGNAKWTGVMLNSVLDDGRRAAGRDAGSWPRLRWLHGGLPYGSLSGAGKTRWSRC